MSLPPLPEPGITTALTKPNGVPMRLVGAYFTADQMRTYGAACAAAAIDERLGPLQTAANKAAHEAVSAIYFDDGADYLPALWSVVRLLAPDLAELLDKDTRLAWLTSDDRANARSQT